MAIEPLADAIRKKPPAWMVNVGASGSCAKPPFAVAVCGAAAGAWEMG